MMNIINIQKKFGRKQVLKDCSFAISPGECIGIVGANGSGKSTLLSIIAGIRKPDKGSISITASNKHIAYIPQENPILPELSVKDNLMLWYCDSKASYEEALSTGVIKLFELDSILNQKASTLSGGMKKRLSIAMAMAGSPSVIILDEPGAALDLPSKMAIRDYLKVCLGQGCAVILTTHDEVELALCDILLVLSEGVLRQIPSHTRGDQLLKEINSHKLS